MYLSLLYNFNSLSPLSPFYLSLCVCLSLCMPLFLSIYYLSTCVCVCMCVSLSLYVSLSLSHSLPPIIYLSICVSFSECLHLSLSLSLFLKFLISISFLAMYQHAFTLPRYISYFPLLCSHQSFSSSISYWTSPISPFLWPLSFSFPHSLFLFLSFFNSTAGTFSLSDF